MPCSLRGCQRTPKGSSEVEVSAGWGLFHDSLDDLWPEFAKRPRKGGFTGPSRVHTTQIQVTVRVSFPRVARLTSTELLPPSTTMNRHDVRCLPEVNARRINLRTGMPSEMSYSFISFFFFVIESYSEREDFSSVRSFQTKRHRFGNKRRHCDGRATKITDRKVDGASLTLI